MNIKEIKDTLSAIHDAEDDHAQEEYDFDEDYEALATQRNQVIQYAEDHELLIDLDSDDALRLFLRRLVESTNDRFIVGAEGWEVCEAFVRPSKTAGHYHAMVTLNSDIKDDFYKIAMQVFYGSDPIRESMNIKRVVGCSKRWNRLFHRESDTWQHLPI